VLWFGQDNETPGRRLMDAGTAREFSPLTIDFLPASELRGLRTRDIDEATVVAMYQNNHAAEALARGQVDDAYWWARAALQGGTSFDAPLSTLGVVYLRHGDLDLAEQVFRQALARAPENTEALANLAHTLGRQPQREAESRALYRQLATLERQPPFHHYVLGKLALQRGDLQAAREEFQREAARSDYHEVHYWLAVVEFKLGHTEEARKHLSIAMKNSTTRGDHDLYAAKLANISKREAAPTAR
jgi:Flp pilus assembly protein TadD